jgi:hypothetical protein
MVWLSKAQQELLNSLQQGNKLIQVNNTWIKENVFIQTSNGTCKRTNIKVVRKLLEFGLIKTKPTQHELIKEFELNEQVQSKTN